MAQQRGMKRAAKVLKRKQKTVSLQHSANVRRAARGPVAAAPAQAAAHDHEHDHEHGDHEHEEPKAKKKAAKKTEE